MPGHIYSKMHRYHDAVYQQEAAARVDHFHMMHDRVLPDQIHNFAHNNEWCIRNMISIGRAHDAEAFSRETCSACRVIRNTIRSLNQAASSMDVTA